MNQLSLPITKPKILLNSSLDTSLFLKPTSSSTTINESYSTSFRKSDRIAPCSIIPGNIVNFDTSLSVYAEKNSKLVTNYPTNCAELIDSDIWLKKYGLKANKLTFQHILSMIGFKQMQDYLTQFNKAVTSKYSGGLFLQSHTKDGLVYNITVDEKKLEDFALKLEDALNTYRLRLQWLNSDSRRLFGVIVEKGICLVLDCKEKDSLQFNQYRNCVLKLLREQISKIASFNIIRCCGICSGIESFKDNAVVVSAKSINDAIDWLNDWNRKIVRPSTDSSTCEAVMKAFQDDSIEAIYLICEGVSANGTREILYDKLVKESHQKKIKLNVISYNCNDAETIEYLKRLAQDSYGPGRFHAYCLLKQIDDYAPGPVDLDPTKNRVIVNKRGFGGAPPGAGVKTDLLLVFEEIQTAKETLDNLNELISTMKKINSQKLLSKNTKLERNQQQQTQAKPRQVDDEYLTSKEWLMKYGLSARKLDLFDALNTVGFRHCDGVIDLKKEPLTGRVFFVGEGKRYYQGDALPREKLVNAKYCDQFAHVLWNDGRIMHVHVTPDLHRSFEAKMNMALEQFERRIDWLSKGSRELFGTVIENNICILIDTSQSMQTSLEFIKRKLAVLMNEQLKSKQRFNLLAFNTKVYPWRDRMVEVDEFNMRNALDWINNLNAQGSTNTLGAIRFALGDLNTEAIYLLSDGRPDQDPRQILSQINLNNKVPIHTISFNCNDTEANKFLSQLARETNGRYHYFNENDWDADPDGAVPYLSEDTSLLKQEIEKGLKYLYQIQQLRDECSNLASPEQIRKRSESAADSVPNETGKYKFQSKYNSKASFNLSKSANFSSQSVLSGLHDIQTLDWVLPETRTLLERQFKNEIMKPRKKSAPIERSKSERNLKKSGKKAMAIKDLSIKQWLKKNSLTALKLTILDALEPYIVNTTTTSDDIRVLEDYADSKAWNDILEFAHISNTGTVQFKLLNPVVINFKKFEEKLQNQITIYQKYLAEKIWSSLTSSERQSLELKYPFEYNETNKDKLLRALEHAHWPISREHVELIEYQIYLANVFMQQAKDLHNYLREKDIIKEERSLKTEISIDSTSKIFKDDADVKDSPRRSPSPETTSDRKLDSSRMIKRDSVRNKDLLRNLDDARNKEIEQLRPGCKVIARNEQVGYYYAAKVIKVYNSRHVDIKFDDTNNMQYKMSFKNAIKYSPSSNGYFSNGDYVMACVINEFGERCWVPGIVQTKLLSSNQNVKVFKILFFNGQEGENTDTELVRINKYSYGSIVNFIRLKLGITSNISSFNEKTEVSVEFTAPSSADRLVQTTRDEEITEKSEEKSSNHINEAELHEVRTEIVSDIKVYLDSLKLDKRYQKMYEEFSRLRKSHKSINDNLTSEIKQLKRELDELKSREPQVIDLNLTELEEKLAQKINEANERNKQLIVHVKDNTRVKESSTSPIGAKEKKTKKKSSAEKKSTDSLKEKNLPELRSGEQVLVRWPDDGWYYLSVVKENLGKNWYEIEDTIGQITRVARQDIIHRDDDTNDTFEAGDTVIALHPDYELSYAPGQVVKLGNDMTRVLVKFYDFVEQVVPRDQVYKLNKSKFQSDVNEIIILERELVGKTVVARNNLSHVYELGKIVSQNGNVGSQYVIEWANGKQSIQNANHIFGHNATRTKIKANDYVIAPLETVFMPGKVVNKKGPQLMVKFINGIEDSNVSEDDCFWIARAYYEDACNFIARYKEVSSTDSERETRGHYQELRLTKPSHAMIQDQREIPVINARRLSTTRIETVEYSETVTKTKKNVNKSDTSSSSSDNDIF